MGWKTAVVFGSQDPFCMTQSSTFEQEFRKLGGKTLQRIEPLADNIDFRTEALRVKQLKPDLVIITNYQADHVALALRTIKFNPPLLAVQMEIERVEAANGALNNAVFAMYEKPDENFIKKYRQRFSEEPGISSDTAYDALMAYAAAVKQAKSFSPPLVQAELRRLKNFQGASGTFSFNELGAVDKTPILWRVDGTRYARVGEEEPTPLEQQIAVGMR